MEGIAASFLTNIYSSSNPPSWFELLAGERLTDSFRNAVQFCALVSMQQHHTWAPILSELWEPLYLISLVGLETWHLARHGASFSEHFYGLQRVPFMREWVDLAITRQGNVIDKNGKHSREEKEKARDDLIKTLLHPQLSRYDIIKSLFYLVALPQVKYKAQQDANKTLDWRKRSMVLFQMYRRHLAAKKRQLYPPVVYQQESDSKGTTTEVELIELSSVKRIKKWLRRGLELIFTYIRRFVYRIYCYTKAYIQQLYGELKHQKGLRHSLTIVMLHVMNFIWIAFPFIYTIHEIWVLYYKVMYLLKPERWPYWTPYLRLQNLILRYPPQHQSRSDLPIEPQTELIQKRFCGLLRHIFKFALLGGIYSVRIYEWWMSNESRLRSHRYQCSTGGLTSKSPSVPPIPHILSDCKVAKDVVYLPQNPRICPLCRQPRSNPVASVSGFVFCYKCLSTSIRTRPRCPVSGLPMSTSQIRRVFENAD